MTTFEREKKKWERMERESTEKASRREKGERKTKLSAKENLESKVVRERRDRENAIREKSERI